MHEEKDYIIPCTVPLNEVAKRQVGGKGWNLFRLRQCGFSVPPWCVLSSRAFTENLRHEKEKFAEMLHSTDLADKDAVENVSENIRNTIMGMELPKYLLDDLREAVGRVLGKKGLYAVRSSAVGEDSAAHSFAGQFDSLLNVPAAGIIEAIKHVWASAYSVSVLTYRQRLGISQENIAVAVIIQQMVQAQSSGILFSRHPEKGTKECVISAGFGLGEGVVANLVETDTYRIGWSGDNPQCDVSHKVARVVTGARGEWGIKTEPLPVELQTRPVLAEKQIRQLRNLAIKAEKHFGVPQDIEWAYDSRSRLIILQARPIVFAEKSARVERTRVWDNSNIVESYPGITLPLTFSFIREGYECTFKNAALNLVLFKKEIHRKGDIYKNMIGLLQGRVYYNLLSWYEMLSGLPGFAAHKKSWDQMIGISRETNFSPKRLSPVNTLWAVLMVMRMLFGVRRLGRRFFTHFNRVYNQYREKDLSTDTADDLIAFYRELERRLAGRWYLTAYNDFCAMKYYDWLKLLCRKWGLDKRGSLHDDLMCGQPGVESVAPVRSLLRLAELFRSLSGYRTLMETGDVHEIHKRIMNNPEYAELKEVIYHHLQRYGDRGLEELKLENRTFREDPVWLIELIKVYYQQNISTVEMERREHGIRAAAEAKVRQRLKNPLKRLVFIFVLTQTRRAVANRENMRFARSRLYGIVRRIFRRMAEHFVQQNLIDTPGDLYYLTIDEVFSHIQGTAVTRDLKGLIELRKAEFAEFADCSPADRLVTMGTPYLNSLDSDVITRASGSCLLGTGCFSGVVKGVAKVVRDPRSANGDRGYILIARSTDPGWVFLMVSAKGIVVERGSVLSHTAIIGRELGIPTIVGVADACRQIPDGAAVTINGGTGEVQWR